MDQVLGAVDNDGGDIAKAAGKGSAKKGNSLLARFDFKSLMPKRGKDKATALDD